MKKYACLLIVILVVAAALGFSRKDAVQQGTQEDMAAQMEMFEKLSRPGEFHKLLEDFVGTWNATVRMWMDPSAPPIVSKGTSTNKLIFGGRYLYGEYLGEFMGSPFKGINIMGYDNAKKEFFSLWIDNTTTGILSSTGSYDPQQKMFHFRTSAFDPISEQIVEMREESHFVSKDEYISVTFSKPPDGPEFKSMEIKYTRQKN
jgi:hypothetical protein